MLNQIILGAGPSGLSYALFNNKTLILEKNSHPGGHASSFFINGFTFDYGPHILFSKDQDILNFIISSLGKNVQKCKRNNKVSYKNKLVKYPFENDLASLDPDDNYECIHSFIFNQYKIKYKKPKNMKEWFLYTFGSGISNKYLIPYNEKVWNIPVEKLSMVWADRIPNPPISDVLKSSIGIKTEGYKHQLYYHYPKKGGYQAISDTWAKSCNIKFNEEITKITLGKSYLLIQTSKESYKAKIIISTINLSSLLKACADWVPRKILQAYEKLIVNPMFVISLGIKGEDKDLFTALYFSDKDFLVNRVSFPRTFSSENAPPGHYSIQAEITYRAGSAISKMKDNEIIKHVINGLRQRNLINGEIILTDIKRLGESYVVYDVSYEKNIRIIREFFTEKNIHLLGRFSFFEYINIDMAVNRSILLRQSLSPNVSKKQLLKKALLKIRSN